MTNQIRIKILALNHFGNGGHPAATPDTLHHFGPDYIRRCLCVASMCPDLTDDARTLAYETAQTLR